MLTGTAFAADLDIPPPVAAPKSVMTPKEISVHQNQPNCISWTDDCITCSRGADGTAPTCSNIGIACQPKAIRCTSGDMPQGQRSK